MLLASVATPGGLRAAADVREPALMRVTPAGGASDPAAPRLVPMSAAPRSADPRSADPPLVRINAPSAPPALRSLPIEPVVPAPIASAGSAPGPAPAAFTLRALPIEPVTPGPRVPALPPVPPAAVAVRSLPLADVAPPRQSVAAVSLAPPAMPRPLAPLPMAQSEHAAPARVPPVTDAIASLPPPRAAAPLPPLPSVPSVVSAPSVAPSPMVPPPIESPRMLPPPVAPAPLPPSLPPQTVATQPPTLQPPAMPSPVAPPPVAPPQGQPPAIAPDQLAGPGPARAAEPPPTPPAPRAAGAGKPADAIVIGSFNIQVFGESKLAKQPVVDVLARVVRGFDVVAIQEVRAKSDNVIPQFVAAINADGSRYQYVVGPRLGRTSSKEQYAFIYDSTRIEIDPGSVGTMPDPADRLHRPPLHARFRVRANPPESGFSFWLVDTHTDPDEVKTEVDALADVFVAMRSLRPDEDDVILLGDLNAAPVQFGKIRGIPGIGWAVSNATTNTRRTKTYDNLIFVPAATAEYTGRWGVLDLQDTFGLSLEKALEVSDHNPVWAAFRPWEAPRVPLAAQPAATAGALPVR